MVLFFGQYPIAVPFVAIVLAEVAKAAIDRIRQRGKIRFFNPGGMPSGHSAFVSALVVVAANRDGVGSTLFMVSTVVALVVMYDAVNLRSQAGLHAKVLNTLAKGADLEESLGHTLPEVVAGSVFGATVAFVLLNL